jgi:hypothetical protein
MKPFGYLHDRLFQCSLAVYAVNRLVLKSHLGALHYSRFNFIWSFSHSHLDDLLLIPAALPVVLWMQQLLGLRKHDGAPSWPEMLGHLAIWSVMCKVVGPFILHIGTPDPWDVLAFAAGGIGACIWWQRPVNRAPAASGHEF